MPPSRSDALLIRRIRDGDQAAWRELIARFEGRLLAFVESRLRDRFTAQDVVQEALVGFLISLPNYDESRPLEGYLFSIAAHKLTDHLRREGRRPALPLSSTENSDGQWEIPGRMRPASSILRSGERRDLETRALADVLKKQIEHWRSRGDWTKVKCMELLFVRGWANKDVASELDLTEQQVANYKFDFLARLKSMIRKQGLNEDVFPELQQSE